jgi:hypothetical protein
LRKSCARQSKITARNQAGYAFKIWLEKYISFAISENVVCFAYSAADARGVRVVTNVVRNAVDVTVSIDVRHGHGRRSRVVLARPCRRQVLADAPKARENDGGNAWFTGENSYKS